MRNALTLPLGVLLIFVASSLTAADLSYSPPTPVVVKEPVYPINSLATGTVIVLAVVEADGRVSEAKVVKSIPSLDDPSVQAVRQWRFEPAQLDGRPVRSKASVSFVYDRGLFRTVGKSQK